MQLDDRELATILAALRFWQRRSFGQGWAESEIATEGGTLCPLNTPEIDDLCERLNQ